MENSKNKYTESRMEIENLLRLTIQLLFIDYHPYLFGEGKD